MKDNLVYIGEARINSIGNYIVEAQGEFHLVKPSLQYIHLIPPSEVVGYTAWSNEVVFKKPITINIPTKWKHLFIITNRDDRRADWAYFKDGLGWSHF